jgi:hypothetical protein
VGPDTAANTKRRVRSSDLRRTPIAERGGCVIGFQKSKQFIVHNQTGMQIMEKRAPLLGDHPSQCLECHWRVLPLSFGGPIDGTSYP